MASLLDFLFYFILAAISRIHWLQYLQMETKYRCSNTGSRFVSIHSFTVNRANSFPWIIQVEVEKVPYIKDCLLGRVETPCTTELSIEDYLLMLFWGIFVSFSIVANIVVFLRTCVLPIWIPPDTAAVERVEAHFFNSIYLGFVECTSIAMGHQMILHALKSFWEYWSLMFFYFTRF